MDRVLAVRVTGFSLILSFFFIVIYQGFRSHDGRNYQVNMTGIFILANQESLLKHISDLAISFGNRPLFLSYIEKFMASDPYIRSFAVRYIWPNQITIDIQEIIPELLIREYGFLTSDCEIIKYQNMNFENAYLFDISNTELNKFLCQQIIKIKPYLTSQINFVRLLSNGDYQIIFDNIEYIITDDLSEMFARIWRIHPDLSRKYLTSPRIVDLRYSSGLAIKSATILSVP